jgi:type IV pilus assembly protein PilX
LPATQISETFVTVDYSFVALKTHLSRRLQRGVSLLFALLALAAMSLAAVALVRSVDSGSLVIGNLAFKQDTTRAADVATERARTWLTTSGANLTADAPTAGYYATSMNNVDPTGRLTSAGNLLDVVNWGDADSCACRASPATCSSCTTAPSPAITVGSGSGAVSARYIITRLCPNTGPVDGTNACAQPANLRTSNRKDHSTQDQVNQTVEPPATAAAYYRVVVRTVGGRNSVSFTETILY